MTTLPTPTETILRLAALATTTVALAFAAWVLAWSLTQIRRHA